MEWVYSYAWLIPVLPLLAALLLGIGFVSAQEWTRSQRSLAAGLSIGTIAVAFVYSVLILLQAIGGHPAYTWQFEWAAMGGIVVPMGYTVDNLAAVMLTVVTGVAMLVMIYSHGYMEHDPGYVRFFCYLSLFSFSMLGLVVSPNLIQIYVFWELVGMCSYLLVGFWFYKKSAADAAQKAFITNRVGDFGLLLGILGIYSITRTFDFEGLAPAIRTALESGAVPLALVILYSLLVYMGPMAKSAQVPLHVWLPDAMEGPTPISALIHAATMVAAGVFLVARIFPVFSEVPAVLEVVAWLGAITAFVGATIAITQNDIKKGLAYSTISQLGYMMMGMGVGAYAAGLFHLVTHACFKAMLFLGSGSVIHGVHDNQDMRLMGGLRKYMPITAATFGIGVLAISGIPPFSGFWSKDEILGYALGHSSWLWLIGFVTAGITAFYMARMYFMTFEGSYRGEDQMAIARVNAWQHNIDQDGIVHGFAELPAYGPGAMDRNEPLHAQDDAHHHGPDDPHAHHGGTPHESPWSMTLPLVVLAVPSVLIGFVGVPWDNWFGKFLGEGGGEGAAEHGFDLAHFLLVGGSSTLLSLTGIALAYYLYILRPELPGRLARRFESLYLFSVNKWNFDWLYEQAFVKTSRLLARGTLEVDRKGVDGVVNFSGLTTLLAGEGLKYLESGRAQFYVLIVFVSLLALIAVLGLL
ncbi:NAD(P)H-quinone oxidoreductase subunit 5 [Gloeobacter kilaueensis]|uniref:NAD(P)H-quinone oxidoreductase subunit F n=1 Tax=Gloeobacter kilaueensis (strain ATCC BAA-2537 / CCAP 1431/1 / ULC 316 / JS1) TaxID=1183438 RepID=U5QLC6_GLOK1|nr:NAD(P)H-quinone oxidoreductase subunit 5 [Gloeobacter kilaueensis]AGY58389.1 NAD(P)H-quinone oxidoreductase subunit F [Gloeobacter kilaueensis JS1]